MIRIKFAGLICALIFATCCVSRAEDHALPAIAEYALPSGNNGGPYGIASGRDGAIWFTEAIATGPPIKIAHSIARLAKTGITTEYALPDNTSAGSIAAGPDGALWFVSGNAIGRITLAGAITEHLVPTKGLLGEIISGSDGALWFTENVGESSPKIWRMTTAGVTTEFSLGAIIAGIAAGRDRAIWFTEPGIDKIGKLSRAGKITEYDLAAKSGPTGIAAGPDGALWFTEYGRKIGRITTAGVVTEFPTRGTPVGITPGPDGALWFTEPGALLGQSEYYDHSRPIINYIGRITTAGRISEFRLPGQQEIGLGAITPGSDGALWFIENERRKIGRIHP